MTPETKVEFRLIGELIVEPVNFLDAMRVISEDHFTEPIHRKAYVELVEHFKKHGTVELTVLSSELQTKKLGNLLTLCVEASAEVIGKPTAFPVYVRALIERRARKDGLQAAKELQKEFESGEDVRESVQKAGQRIMAIRDLFEVDTVAGPKAVAEEALAFIDRVNTGSDLDVIKWPHVDLNRVTGGMDPGNLVVISGIGKGGKTKLMLETIWENARRGNAGLIFSAEMRRLELFVRQGLAEGKISYMRWRNQRLTDQEKERLNKTVESYAKLPIYVRHGVFNILDIAAEAERYVRKKVRVIGVDYIQKVQSVDHRESREREVAAISSGLKDIAVKYGIPVIALSQVNKDMEARESRAIEHDMDKMVTIKREEGESIAELKLVQRFGKGGAFGDIKLHWDLEFGSWSNHAETMDDAIKREEEYQQVLPI